MEQFPMDATEGEYDKADEMECGCSCMSLKDRAERKGLEGRTRSSQYIGRLQRDLAGSYYWSGNCLKDYCFFIANWHPFLGMWLSHPAHPWSKTERVMTFVFSCCLTLIPSAMVTHYMSEQDVKEDSDKEAWTIFWYITLPVMIWEIVLYWVAIGDTFCKGRTICCCDCTHLCDCCAACCRGCKYCCFCASLSFSLLAGGISGLMMYRWNAPYISLLRPFVYSRIQSWCTWFIIWTFLPCQLGFISGWCAEKAALEKESKEEGGTCCAESSSEGDSEDDAPMIVKKP